MNRNFRSAKASYGSGQSSGKITGQAQARTFVTLLGVNCLCPNDLDFQRLTFKITFYACCSVYHIVKKLNLSYTYNNVVSLS